MAVQAQYPSNVLLLSRNGQNGHEFSSSLQPQPGGGFLDQSHMLFSDGGNNNRRKRGREVTAANTTGVAAPINSFTMQTQPTQLIDLSQLHNHQQHQPHQPNVVSTGLRLSFGGDQQQLQQNQNQQFQYHRHEQQQQQQKSLVPQSSALLSLLSEDFAAQIKRQREELDQFLQAQGEQLRRTLAEKRQRHYRALLGAAEESVVRRLREKQAEVEKATRRNAELEARAAQLSVEARVWQAKARAQEATAATLQAQLQQAIMSGVPAQDSRRADEGLKCAGGGVEAQAEDAESAYVDPERASVSGPACKGCRTRVASVVLLPCRHLCLCTDCDRVAQACPLCLTVRNSSVEVFLS
ncbi:hypothetical protein SLA2020_091840 [Shorea laevis]